MKLKTKKRLTTTLIVFTTLLILIISSIFGVYFKNRYNISNAIKNGYLKIENIKKEDFNNKYPTKLYDKDGNLLREFKVIEYQYVNINNINDFIKNSFIAIEDERFYKHKGIDYIGIMRSLSKIILSKGEIIQGGSTITQQLAKNMFLTFDVDIYRKLEEMVIAQELEKKFSKDEILEFYLNNIYFGYGCYGVESASNYFFSKSNKDLTLSESAFLSAITNNPTLFDPINNFDNTTKRKENILNKMFELGYISEEELNTAMEEKIELNIKETYFNNELVKYEESYAINNAIEILMKENGFKHKYIFNSKEEREEYLKEYNEAYSKYKEELLIGGYEIYTSIDLEKQKELQAIVDQEFYGFSNVQENGLYMRQAAATVIDNSNGEVVAIVGGRSQEGNTFNRAFLGARQPGSTLKPLISYTPAFEKGLYPDYVMEDKKIEGGPLNWYSGYKGDVTLRYATEISLNTIPYRLTNNLGMDLVLGKLEDMEFGFLTEDDKTPIISIGGLTQGTTTLEMAAAYSTLARNGEYISPSSVRKIIKSYNKEIVYENDYYKKRVFDEGASYLMTDTMKGVLLKPHGTGYSARMSNWKNQAGKTGSTDYDKDIWTIGYTPYYTTAVWVGDEIPTPIYSGYEAPKNIWRNIMNYLHQGLEDIEFKKPDTVYIENNLLKTKPTKDNELLSDRIKIENERKLNEDLFQKNRLEESEYRIKYSLTEEEE
ncbi:MAG: penicillin-binding protein, partial [Clostridiales bacterium]|nr:penicillin-binding protein [Clostridiales bacterium]